MGASLGCKLSRELHFYFEKERYECVQRSAGKNKK